MTFADVVTSTVSWPFAEPVIVARRVTIFLSYECASFKYLSLWRTNQVNHVPDMLEDMRAAYKSCEPLLSTAGTIINYQWSIEEGIWDEMAGVEVCVQFEGQLSYPLNRPHETWAFDRYALQAYTGFLRARYEDDIGRLNGDWGTRYASFTDTMPPKSYGEGKEHGAFLSFYRQNLLDTAVELTDVIERRLPEGKKWLYMSHQTSPG